jgi:hypothetical protein
VACLLRGLGRRFSTVSMPTPEMMTMDPTTLDALPMCPGGPTATYSVVRWFGHASTYQKTWSGSKWLLGNGNHFCWEIVGGWQRTSRRQRPQVEGLYLHRPGMILDGRLEAGESRHYCS